jgi:hypothetical protein
MKQCGNGLIGTKNSVNFLALGLSMLSTLIIGVSIVFCCRWCLKRPKSPKKERRSSNDRDQGLYIRSNLLHDQNEYNSKDSYEEPTSMELSRE